MSLPNISDNQVLERLFVVGLAELPPSRLGEISRDLEARAVETGLAASVFVAQAVDAIIFFVAEHEARGGIRTAFLAKLDETLRSHLQEVQRGDPLNATKHARELRDEVVDSISKYDPSDSHSS